MRASAGILLMASIVATAASAAPSAPLVRKALKAPAAVAQSHKLVIRWERPTPEGLEEVGLIFDSSGARLVRNSNFLDDQRGEATLGRFHVDRLNPRLLRAFRAALEVLDRTPKLHAASAVRPKGPRFFVNLTPIPSDSAYSVAIAEILRDIDRKANWVADDGVKIRRNQKRGAHLGRSKVQPAALSCRAGNKSAERCDLAAYGTVYFGDQR